MKTYQNIVEVAYKDLNNLKKIKSMDDVKRAAHSQGYEVTDFGKHDKYGSHGTMDVKHRKSGEPVRANKSRGAIGGKKLGKGGEVDSTTVNTFADAVKADMKKRGRVDKTPQAKEARKKESIINRARKKKQRDPFTREHTEWWVNMFREATEREMKEFGQFLCELSDDEIERMRRDSESRHKKNVESAEAQQRRREQQRRPPAVTARNKKAQKYSTSSRNDDNSEVQRIRRASGAPSNTTTHDSSEYNRVRRKQQKGFARKFFDFMGSVLDSFDDDNDSDYKRDDRRYERDDDDRESDWEKQQRSQNDYDKSVLRKDIDNYNAQINSFRDQIDKLSNDISNLESNRGYPERQKDSMLRMRRDKLERLQNSIAAASENMRSKQDKLDRMTESRTHHRSMKTFNQFLEATERDLSQMGASKSQIAALKARQAKRGYGFQSNDERNKTAPAKTQSPGLIGTTERTPTERRAPKPEWDGKNKSGSGYPRPPKKGPSRPSPGVESKHKTERAGTPSPRGALVHSPSGKVKTSSSENKARDSVYQGAYDAATGRYTAPQGRTKSASKTGKGYMTAPDTTTKKRRFPTKDLARNVRSAAGSAVGATTKALKTRNPDKDAKFAKTVEPKSKSKMVSYSGEGRAPK